MIYHTVDGENYEELFPGTTVYKNKLGGTVIVFSGTPVAPMDYLNGFSFLTYSRKQSLIKMLKETGNLPIYYDGHEEMYVKSGKMPNGERLLAFINIGFDPVEEIVLGTELPIKKASWLTPDGKLKKAKVRRENGKVIVKKGINTLDPVILIVK